MRASKLTRSLKEITRKSGAVSVLRRVEKTVRDIAGADHAYICLWSHKDWNPVHIHFVVQPVWNRQRQQFEKNGPYMQAQMFSQGEIPSNQQVEKFTEKAREALNQQ